MMMVIKISITIPKYNIPGVSRSKNPIKTSDFHAEDT